MKGWRRGRPVRFKPSADDRLASQFEVQNAPKSGAQAAKPVVSWQNLYDVWIKECGRRDNSKASYLAAVKLFASFCDKAPQAVPATRADLPGLSEVFPGPAVDEPRMCPRTALISPCIFMTNIYSINIVGAAV